MSSVARQDEATRPIAMPKIRVPDSKKVHPAHMLQVWARRLISSDVSVTQDKGSIVVEATNDRHLLLFEMMLDDIARNGFPSGKWREWTKLEEEQRLENDGGAGKAGREGLPDSGEWLEDPEGGCADEIPGHRSKADRQRPDTSQ